MDKSLLEAFRTTVYLVCLNPIEWARIALDQPLPASLQAIVGEQPWAFITAWNPRALARDAAENLAAQRELHRALQASPDIVMHPALGVGRDLWHEPSLFVIGADPEMLDPLAVAHQQLGYIHGRAHGLAHLRLLE